MESKAVDPDADLALTLPQKRDRICGLDEEKLGLMDVDYFRGNGRLADHFNPHFGTDPPRTVESIHKFGVRRTRETREIKKRMVMGFERMGNQGGGDKPADGSGLAAGSPDKIETCQNDRQKDEQEELGIEEHGARLRDFLSGWRFFVRF